MGTETVQISFESFLRTAEIRGLHTRPWSRTLTTMQVAIDGDAPAGGALVLAVMLGGVAGAQQFTVPEGVKFLPITFATSGLSVLAGNTVAVECVTPSGASNVRVTLLGTTGLSGDLASDTTDQVALTRFLNDEDVPPAFGCTLADPSSELIQLFDDPVNPTGDLNTTQLAQLVTQINGIMESKIGVKHALPIMIVDDDVPKVTETLRGYALSLFRWMAIRDKPHMAEAYKGTQSAYNDALSWLDDVAAGKASLGTSKVVAGAEARTAAVKTQDHTGTFNRDRLRGW